MTEVAVLASALAGSRNQRTFVERREERNAREVDSSKVSGEREDSLDESRVLVREPIVLCAILKPSASLRRLPPNEERTLPSPGRSLDVGEGSDRLVEGRLLGHLGELGVLHEHRSDDSKEGLVRGEDAGATGEGVALEPSYEEARSACAATKEGRGTDPGECARKASR